MSKRTKIFKYLRTFVAKQNHYRAIVFCDKFGNVLRNRFPKVEEYFEHINEFLWYSSDCIASGHASNVMNLVDLTGKKFVKIVDPELFARIYGRTNFTRGKVPGTRKYVYQNIHDLLYHEETFFHDGNVWCFGNLDFVNDLQSILDEIRVCVCNVDFSEYDEELDYYNFFDWATTHGFVEVYSKQTDLSKDLVARSKRKKRERHVEILPNGMTMVKTLEPAKGTLPDIFDYEIRHFEWRQNPQ